MPSGSSAQNPIFHSRNKNSNPQTVCKPGAHCRNGCTLLCVCMWAQTSLYVLTLRLLRREVRVEHNQGQCVVKMQELTSLCRTPATMLKNTVCRTVLSAKRVNQRTYRRQKRLSRVNIRCLQYLVALSVGSQQEYNHPAIGWMFQQQLTRPSTLKVERSIKNENMIQASRMTSIPVFNIQTLSEQHMRGLIFSPSVQSYWRGWSTASSSCNCLVRLYPKERAACLTDSPVLDPGNTERSPASSPGRWPPRHEPPAHCIPTDRSCRERIITYN